MSAPSTTNFTAKTICRFCKALYPSRNQLFEHLPHCHKREPQPDKLRPAEALREMQDSLKRLEKRFEQLSTERRGSRPSYSGGGGGGGILPSYGGSGSGPLIRPRATPASTPTPYLVSLNTVPTEPQFPDILSANDTPPPSKTQSDAEPENQSDSSDSESDNQSGSSDSEPDAQSQADSSEPEQQDTEPDEPDEDESEEYEEEDDVYEEEGDMYSDNDYGEDFYDSD